jgi:hypothetical protein
MPHPAQLNDNSKCQRCADGKLQGNVLSRVVKMIYRMSDVDIQSEKRKVHCGEQLHPELTIVRPVESRIANNSLCL